MCGMPVQQHLFLLYMDECGAWSWAPGVDLGVLGGCESLGEGCVLGQPVQRLLVQGPAF
jgi:hypothetical protein